MAKNWSLRRYENANFSGHDHKDARDIGVRIKQFIIDNFLFGTEDKTFTAEDSFWERGIIDSTGILELIQYIEDNFAIKVEDNELLPENLDSLANVTSFILSKSNNQAMSSWEETHALRFRYSED